MRKILEQNLGRVDAPPELWERVQNPRGPRPQRRMAWVLAAALPVVAIMWGFHPREKPAQAPSRLHFSAACLGCHTVGRYNSH
jgi:hypothetical protein